MIQNSQIDISFIKDLFLKTKNVLTLCKRYLLCVQEEHDYLSENRHISFFLKDEKIFTNQEKTRLTFNFLDKENLYLELKELIKKCQSKEVIKIELGIMLLHFEINQLKNIYNLFEPQLNNINKSLIELDDEWDKLFDRNFDHNSFLISTELYDSLLIIKSLVSYLDDVKNIISDIFLTIRQTLNREQENKDSVNNFEESDQSENNRTLNSILILLDKIGFFNLPQVENLGENKKGELIAFLTNYKASTCKVTVKEMTNSPNGQCRNNPYKSKKAQKDANDFLTKLNI